MTARTRLSPPHPHSLISFLESRTIRERQLLSKMPIPSSVSDPSLKALPFRVFFTLLRSRDLRSIAVDVINQARKMELILLAASPQLSASSPLSVRPSECTAAALSRTRSRSLPSRDSPAAAAAAAAAS